MRDLVVQGRGGDTSGRTPREARDSLRSTQIADILDLISEGECEGIVGGLRGVFLDGVPVENADGTKNFENVEFEYTVGTQGQAALPGNGGVLNEIGVAVQVHAGTPIVRTIINPDIDTVRVTLGIPQLSSQDLKSGDLGGTSVEFAVDVQSNGGGYVERYQRTLGGKTMSLYTFSVDIKLTGAAPHDIRVRRVTPDSTASNVVNAFSWLTYTEIRTVKLRYPNSAVGRWRFDAQQWGRIPVRSYNWKGVKCKVPTNYDPVTRTYTGAWDGTFKRAWTDNAMWTFYEVVTNKRWGLGRFVDEAFQNKWSAYTIAQYCDELVPDGFGGMEPRFRFNWVFTTRAEAFNVLQDLATCFRGMVFWCNSSVEYSQDAPQEPEMLFTRANTVDGFSYQDTSEKTLHSVFITYWNDLTQQGKRVPEVYTVDELLDRYGVRELSLNTIGITSRGQAARMCRWARHSEQMEGEAISLRVGSDGAVAQPGKVFKVSDPSVAGERLAGRIRSATASELVLDAPVELQTGETYTLMVVKPKADDVMGMVVEERAVITPASTTDTLVVSPSFSFVPEVEGVWGLQSNAIQMTTWRCLGVKPVDGKSQYDIAGIAHNPSKFDAIEHGLALDLPPVSRMTATVLPPSALTLVETIYTDGTVNKSRLTASWVPSASGLDHLVSWRKDTGWWQSLPRTSAQTVDVGGLDAGVYEVIVCSINALGSVSSSAQASITLQGGASGVRTVRLRASSLAFKVPTTGPVTPSSITITADLGALPGPPTWAVASGTATLIGTGSTRTLTYADMADETVTISATVIDGGETYADLLTIIKVRDGAPGSPGEDGGTGAPGNPGDPGEPGAPATSAMLSLDVIALPADGDGAVTSYAGAFTSLVIWAGDVIDATGWTYSRLNGPGVESDLAGASLTITSMSGPVDSSYIDITATRAGSASITKRVSVVKSKRGVPGPPGTGTSGPRGSITLLAEVTLNAWSDSAANEALVDHGYDGPVNLDVVTLYNPAAPWSETRVYFDGTWYPIAAYIHGNLLIDGTVIAQKMNVNQLSAISADLGAMTAGSIDINGKFQVAADGSTVIRSAATGQRLEFTSTVLKVFDNGGNLRVKMGDLS